MISQRLSGMAAFFMGCIHDETAFLARVRLWLWMSISAMRVAWPASSCTNSELIGPDSAIPVEETKSLGGANTSCRSVSQNPATCGFVDSGSVNRNKRSRGRLAVAGSFRFCSASRSVLSGQGFFETVEIPCPQAIFYERGPRSPRCHVNPKPTQ